jgi:hypothetical protein
VGTFNFSAKYLSKKDSSTMLPELTEFVPATRMGIPTQFQILKRKRHSKALRRSEKMHPARFSRPKSTFLTIPILVAGTNSVSKIHLWSLFLIVHLHLQWNAVLAQIVLCLAEAFYEIVDFLA